MTGKLIRWLSGARENTENDENFPVAAALAPTLVTVAVTVLAGSGALLYLSPELRPVEALYYSVVTVTTVGYGDYAPQTDAARAFITGYALFGTILLAPDFPGWLAPVVMGATEQVRLSDTFGFASTGAVLWAACGITLGSFTTAANVNVESAVRVTARTWLAAFVVAAVAATARGGLTADEVQGSIGLGFSLATWRAVYAEEWWL